MTSLHFTSQHLHLSFFFLSSALLALTSTPLILRDEQHKRCPLLYADCIDTLGTDEAFMLVLL